MKKLEFQMNDAFDRWEACPYGKLGAFGEVKIGDNECARCEFCYLADYIRGVIWCEREDHDPVSG